MIRSQVIKIIRIKEISFSLAFTVLAVYAPILIHAVSGVDGGRTYLPMPFFVLAAGLLLGWRAGLATALMSPVVSYLISGMPMANILPFVTLQLAAYGMIAGILGKKYDTFVSVAAAIATGWLAIGVSMLLFSKMSALDYVAQGLRAGFPGIALQIVLIPLIALLAKKHLQNE